METLYAPLDAPQPRPRHTVAIPALTTAALAALVALGIALLVDTSRAAGFSAPSADPCARLASDGLPSLPPVACVGIAAVSDAFTKFVYVEVLLLWLSIMGGLWLALSVWTDGPTTDIAAYVAISVVVTAASAWAALGTRTVDRTTVWSDFLLPSPAPPNITACEEGFPGDDLACVAQCARVSPVPLPLPPTCSVLVQPERLIAQCCLRLNATLCGAPPVVGEAPGALAWAVVALSALVFVLPVIACVRAARRWRVRR